MVVFETEDMGAEKKILSQKTKEVLLMFDNECQKFPFVNKLMNTVTSLTNKKLAKTIFENIF